MDNMSGIDFVICTYNRSAYLKKCIISLLPQMVPARTCLTVVDNRSTDDTKEWILELTKVNPVVRYLYQPEQGLSHARNMAWRESRFDWIFYIDDDCLPPPDFVNAALQLIQDYTVFDALGGPIRALYEHVNPHWMPEGFGSFSMAYHQVTQLENGFIRGGCFMIRRKILHDFGGFKPDLGVRGDTLRYGEEIELQVRMRKAGLKIGYAPSLQIGHFVRTEKTTIFWILKAEYAKRRDKMLFDPVSLPMATLNLFRTVLGRVIWTPVHLFHLVTSGSYPAPRAFYDIFKPLAYRVGEWVGVLIYTFTPRSQRIQ